MTTEELLAQIYYGNSIQAYITAIIYFIGLLIIFKILERVIIKNLSILTKKTKTDIDDKVIAVLEDIPLYFYVVLSIYFPLRALILTEATQKFIHIAFLIVVVVQVIRSITTLIEFIGTKMLFKSKTAAEKNKGVVSALKIIIKIIIWSTGLLLILSNAGVNITSLVASLGIGGIAIALALQNVLGDLFSAFSIYVDKPIQEGDFIKIGSDVGTVKKIGLKTTRIETLGGEELVISNNEITSTRIQNFHTMQRRRIVYTIGVTYDTPTKKLRLIPDMIKDIFKGKRKVTLDRVHFKNMGDFNLQYEIVYYIESAEYSDYMDFQQELNLSLMESFNKQKIELP